MKVSREALYAVPALMALAAVVMLFSAIWIDDDGLGLKLIMTAFLTGFLTVPAFFITDSYVNKGKP